MVLAKHYAYYITFGVAASNQLNHLCHNQACLNPYHLYDGNQKQNIHDAIASGRFVNGMLGRGKFSEDQVLDVLSLKAEGFRNIDISHLTGITPGSIQAIVMGRTYSFT
jgi:hypothetical protein